MLDWVAGVIASTNAATDITKSLLDVKTDAAVNAKAVELTGVLLQLQQQLMSAQVEQMALMERVRTLQAELVKADDSARYQRHQFPSGDFAYQLKEEHRGEGALFFICSHCHENDGKQITLHEYTDSDVSLLTCPSCKARIRKRPDVPYVPAPNPYAY